MTANIACSDATLISSTDGVTIAMHDFGGTGSPILLSHATGFHGHCMKPIADGLMSNHHVMALDHRGYGDAETVDPAGISWDQYGLDALAAAQYLSDQHNGEPIVGIGHSMGGASLLMAAQRAPQLFRALFVFEPIVFPPVDESVDRPVNPLAGGARKRRSTFDSYEDALANYASKPPMSAFHPDAREQYVLHGFKKTDNGVELKCLPEHEAVTYETGGTSGAWEQLGNIQTRTWVISGALAPFQPSSFAEAVSQQMTSSTFIRWDEVGHFGPLERPDLIVTYVASVLATLSS